MKRDYCLFMCRVYLLAGVPETTKTIGPEISLPALGSMLPNKMTGSRLSVT